MNQVTESILVEDVDFDSSQPRQTIKKLPELKDDIKLRGQIYPVVVTPYADREGRRYWGADATKFKYRYWLIDGERRMKALKELGYEKVNATIQLESDEMKLYEMQFVTNSKREDVNPVDMAKALQRYLRLFESNKCEGSPMKKIATLTGFSTSYLASRLIILKAPKWCVSGIYTGKLGATIPAEIGRSIPIKWQSSVYESVKAGAIKNVLDVRVISKKIKMIYEEYPENIEQADEMIKSVIWNPRPPEGVIDKGKLGSVRVHIKEMFKCVGSWDLRGLSSEEYHELVSGLKALSEQATMNREKKKP
jgi:ParB/RepB/Spo0J family partition protein